MATPSLNTISLVEFRNKLGETITRVRYTREHGIVTNKGKAHAEDTGERISLADFQAGKRL